MTLFVLAKEYCFVPEENLEPNSAGLKSSRTRGVRHKSLEENCSAWIKERSLIGHIMCLEKNPRKIVESEILTGRCPVQSFSFKVCFVLWIKNVEQDTCWYRDPMPF